MSAKSQQPAFKSIAEMRKAAGFRSQKDLLIALGVSPKNCAFGVALDKGKVPTNHPLLPKLVTTLKQPEDKVLALISGDPLDDRMLRMVSTNLQRSLLKQGGNGNGKALVPTRGQRNALVLVRSGNRRNSLTRMDHATRQAARSLADTINSRILAGKAYLEVVPVEDLALVLNDYFERHGIKDRLILPPSYAANFG